MTRPRNKALLGRVSKVPPDGASRYRRAAGSALT
ncbi:hypothetical protein ACFWWM_44015 [Streptomyces sp. NPDC058682]